MIAAAIRAIRPLVREINIAYLHWAMREICPAHRDVPAIVLRLHTLHDERRA